MARRLRLRTLADGDHWVPTVAVVTAWGRAAGLAANLLLRFMMARQCGTDGNTLRPPAVPNRSSPGKARWVRGPLAMHRLHAENGIGGDYGNIQVFSGNRKRRFCMAEWPWQQQ